jgi:uncharacterized protein (TIGR02996 family)
MPRPVSLTDEFVYRIAPDGKSVQSALDLLRRGAFREPKMSADGTRLDAKCQGSAPRPYTVRVDLSDRTSPRTGCNCLSFKHPCKHALGLILLAARSPELFEQEGAPAGGKAPPGVYGTTVRAKPTKKAKAKAPADVGEALMQAILAEPEDEGPRLVYADWLEENGGPQEQARAEFIRVQVELAKTPENTPRHKELSAREKALWKAHKAEWLKDLPPHLRKRDLRFHRGFLEELSLPPKTWAKHGEKLFGRHPVHRLRLSGSVDRHVAGALAVIPYLARVRVVDLSGCQLVQPLKTLQILFNTPFLSGLNSLVLRACGLGTREVGVLVGSPVLARLRALDLADNAIGPGGAEALAGSDKVVKLKELALANNPLGESGAKALAASPHLRGLTRLDLRGVGLGEGAKSALRKRFGERVVLD